MDRTAIRNDANVAKVVIDEYEKVLLPLELDTRSFYYWGRLSVIRAAMNAQGHGNWCSVRLKTHYIMTNMDRNSKNIVDDYILRAIKLYQKPVVDATLMSTLTSRIGNLGTEALAVKDNSAVSDVFNWDLKKNIELTNRTVPMRERVTLAIREFRGNALFAKKDPVNTAAEAFSDTPAKFEEKMALLLTLLTERK